MTQLAIVWTTSNFLRERITHSSNDFPRIVFIPGGLRSSLPFGRWLLFVIIPRERRQIINSPRFFVAHGNRLAGGNFCLGHLFDPPQGESSTVKSLVYVDSLSSMNGGDAASHPTLRLFGVIW